MRIGDLCVCDVAACRRDTTVARAGSLMRKYNVGALPVVDRNERPIGMLTDRDIALEVTRRNTPPSEILVEDVMSQAIATCQSHDDVRDVLRIMARERVRRLPVVDERGFLDGIVSIDDIICTAVDMGGSRDIPYHKVLETLCEISEEYRAGNDRARDEETEPVRHPRREERVRS